MLSLKILVKQQVEEKPFSALPLEEENFASSHQESAREFFNRLEPANYYAAATTKKKTKTTHAPAHITI